MDRIHAIHGNWEIHDVFIGSQITRTDGDPFDFEDPDNHLREFQVRVTVPFSAVTYCPPPLQKYFAPGQTISAASVFRNYHK